MKRAANQAGHCWAQAMIATSELPSLLNVGGKRMLMGGIFAGLPCQKPKNMPRTNSMWLQEGLHGAL